MKPTSYNSKEGWYVHMHNTQRYRRGELNIWTWITCIEYNSLNLLAMIPVLIKNAHMKHKKIDKSNLDAWAEEMFASKLSKLTCYDSKVRIKYTTTTHIGKQNGS